MSVVSVKLEDQIGLFNSQKKRPLSIIEEQDGDDGDDADIDGDPFDTDVKVSQTLSQKTATENPASTTAKTTTTTTTKTMTTTKTRAKSVEKSNDANKMGVKKKPQNTDTPASKSKTHSSTSKLKSSTAKTPNSASSKVTNKIVQFSKTVKIAPKSDSNSKVPPPVARKPKSPSPSPSPTGVKSPSKSERPFSFVTSPTSSQPKPNFSRPKKDTPTEDDEIARSIKNIVKRTVSKIESHVASASSPSKSNVKARPLTRKSLSEEKSTASSSSKRTTKVRSISLPSSSSNELERASLISSTSSNKAKKHTHSSENSCYGIETPTSSPLPTLDENENPMSNPVSFSDDTEESTSDSPPFSIAREKQQMISSIQRSHIEIESDTPTSLPSGIETNNLVSTSLQSDKETENLVFATSPSNNKTENPMFIFSPPCDKTENPVSTSLPLDHDTEIDTSVSFSSSFDAENPRETSSPSSAEIEEQSASLDISSEESLLSQNEDPKSHSSKPLSHEPFSSQKSPSMSRTKLFGSLRVSDVSLLSSDRLSDSVSMDFGSRCKSPQGLSDGQGLARIREAAENLKLRSLTSATTSKAFPSPPSKRVPFSVRQSPKLGQRSIPSTYSLNMNNSRTMTKPVFSFPDQAPNKGDFGTSDSENEENLSQSFTKDKSSMSSLSPYMMPKFQHRRGSYFFTRRLSSESHGSLSENETGIDVSPHSASDFNQLIETADRLCLSTRRPSTLQWRQQYVESPGISGLSFKNGINGDIDERLTSERKEKINDALEWLRNELQEMRSQDQMLARQLLTIRNDIHQLKLKRCTAEHQELLDDFKSELEELQEFSDVLDIPQPIYENNPLKHIGVTRLNISARRFSAC